MYARKVLVSLTSPPAVPTWYHMELEVSYFSNCLNTLITFASSGALSFPGQLVIVIFQAWSGSV